MRALITEPAPDHQTRHGAVAVRGVAWSGAAPIDRVEIKVGGGVWQPERAEWNRLGYGNNSIHQVDIRII